MDSLIDQLVETFMKFPGIGPRQARRFVYYLLRANHGTIENLSQQIKELKKSITQCQGCFRFFPLPTSTYHLEPKNCPICSDKNRDASLLMLVEKDMDLENIERSGAFHGYYFVLGGLIPILDKQPERAIRSRELLTTVESRQKNGLQEIILALAANPEGDYTTEYLKKLLSSQLKPSPLKTTILGRGLSTGTELEYSDADTLKNALKHRE